MIDIRQYVMGKQDCWKCKFEMTFGWISYIATALKMCGMYSNLWGAFQNKYEPFNLGAYRISTMYINNIFQYPPPPPPHTHTHTHTLPKWRQQTTRNIYFVSLFSKRERTTPEVLFHECNNNSSSLPTSITPNTHKIYSTSNFGMKQWPWSSIKFVIW